VGSEKVLENFSWGSWKVLEKSWNFLSVKEWEPWFIVVLCSAHKLRAVNARVDYDQQTQADVDRQYRALSELVNIPLYLDNFPGLSVGHRHGRPDGKEVFAPPPKKKIWKKVFWGANIMQIFSSKYRVKFLSLVNFSGKYHVKFGYFVNFHTYIFGQKCLDPHC